MKTKYIRQSILFVLLSMLFVAFSQQLNAQCTESNDPDMAKYKRKTDNNENVQSCSQCAYLALLFCSATYTVKPDDKSRVGSLISQTKNNIRLLGNPICCPELLSKQPQWGIKAGSQSGGGTGNNSGTGTGTGNPGSSGSSGGSGNNLSSGTGNSTGSGQQGDASLGDLIDQILSGLQSNPDNPLNVTNNVLSAIAGLLDDGTMKSKLSTYGNNLGTDSDLGMRQVYWDLNKAFNANPRLGASSQYGSLGQELNILVDNPAQLTQSIIDGVNNYQPGIFTNDPAFMNQMYAATGSQTAAEALGHAAEIAGALSVASQEVNAFKENYAKTAEVSKKQIYYEADGRMRTALIDATLGIFPLTMLTPIYRYDFDNGSYVMPDNGILKFVNPAKNQVIDLVAIENRNDGVSNANLWSHGFGYGGFNFPQLIVPSPDDKYFYLNTGKLKINTGCMNCLEKNFPYIINTETGKAHQIQRGKGVQVKSKAVYIDYDNVLESHFFNDKFTVLNYYDNKLFEYIFTIPDLDFKLSSVKVSGKEPFSYRDEIKILDDIHKSNSNGGISRGHKANYTFKSDKYLLTLFWGKERGRNSGKIMTSTYLLINEMEGETKNGDMMVNELTGIVKSKDDILFFVTASGKVGSIDLKSNQPADPAFVQKMRASVKSQVLDPYDFTWNRAFQFTSTFSSSIYNLPFLTLSPDEKHLIYVLDDKLFLIDVNDLERPKKFKLSIEPHMVFFAKENGEPTMYLQAFNEYKFPVTKKYDLNKLIQAPMEDPVVKKTPVASRTNPNPAQTNTGQRSNQGGSIADELKKLNDLFKAGALTQEEYDLAKKKLIEKL